MGDGKPLVGFYGLLEFLLRAEILGQQKVYALYIALSRQRGACGGGQTIAVPEADSPLHIRAPLTRYCLFC
jgi:hypothetical protein